VQQYAFFQADDDLSAVGGDAVVDHHQDRLAEFVAEDVEQAQGLVGTARVQRTGRFVGDEAAGVPVAGDEAERVGAGEMTGERVVPAGAELIQQADSNGPIMSYRTGCRRRAAKR